MANEHRPLINLPDPDDPGDDAAQPGDDGNRDDPARTRKFVPPIGEPFPMPDHDQPQYDEDLLRRDTERFEMLKPSDMQPDSSNTATAEKPEQAKETADDKSTEPETPQKQAEEDAKDLAFDEDFELNMIQKLIVGALMVIMPIIGIAMCKATAVPSIIVAIIVSTGFQSIFKRLRVSRWKLTAYITFMVILLYGMALFPGYKMWHANFGQFKEKIKALAVKMQVSVNEKSSELSNKIQGDYAEPKQVNLEVSEKTQRVLDNVDEKLRFSAWQLFRTFLQLTFISIGVLLFPVLVVATTPGLGKAVRDDQRRGIMAWVGPGLFRIYHRIGQIGLTRTVKAFLITALCTIGMGVSGISSFWFISGVVFCFALVCNLSFVIAFILGGLMVPYAANWMYSGIGVLITVAVLFLAEKKLHWYLYLVPMAKRYKLPPEMLGKTEGSRVIGKAMKLIPHLVSLLVFAAVGYLCWTMWDVSNINSARRDDIRKATELVQEEKYDEAVKEMSAIVDKKYPGHPNNIAVMYKILRARVQQGNYEKAMFVANALSTYKTKQPTGFIPQMRHKITEILETENYKLGHTKEKPYVVVVKGIHNLNMPDELKTLGDKIVGIDPQNEWGYIALARSAFLKGNNDEASRLAKKGLEVEPEMPELVMIDAEARLAARDYEGAEIAIDKLRELLPDDQDVRDLWMRLLKERPEGGGGTIAPEGAPAGEGEAGQAEGENAEQGADGEAEDGGGEGNEEAPLLPEE